MFKSTSDFRNERLRDITNEAIDPQLASPYAGYLSNIFTQLQDRIDMYADTLIKEQGTGNLLPALREKYDKEISVVLSEASELTAKYTGLRIDTEVYPKNMGATVLPIGIQLRVGLNVFDMTDALGLAISGDSFKNVNDDKELIDLVKEISSKFDPKTGHVSPKKLSNGKEIMGTLYWCPIMTFYSKYCVNKENLHLSISPNEMVAIYLHEVGHLITLVENIGNLAVMDKSLNNYISGVTDRDPQDVIKASKQMLDAGLTSGLIENDEHVEKIQTLIKAFEDENKSLWDFASTSVLNSLMIVVTAIVIIFIVYAMLIYAILGIIVSGLVYSYSTQMAYGKTDNARNDNWYQTFEYWSDEFVVQHGFGGYLASSLSKINTLIQSINNTTGNKYLRHSSVLPTCINMLAGLNSMLSSILVVTLNEPHGHDSSRLEAVLKVMYNNLKDTALPDNQKRELVMQTELARKALSDSKKGELFTKIFTKFVGTTDRIISILSGGSLLRTIFEGRKINDELSEVVDSIEKITNNSLHFHAAKLESLK